MTRKTDMPQTGPLLVPPGGSVPRILRYLRDPEKAKKSPRKIAKALGVHRDLVQYVLELTPKQIAKIESKDPLPVSPVMGESRMAVPPVADDTPVAEDPLPHKIERQERDYAAGMRRASDPKQSADYMVRWEAEYAYLIYADNRTGHRMTLSPKDGRPVAVADLTRDHLDPEDDGYEAFWPLPGTDNNDLGKLPPPEKLAAVEDWPEVSDPLAVANRDALFAKLKRLASLRDLPCTRT